MPCLLFLYLLEYPMKSWMIYLYIFCIQLCWTFWPLLSIQSCSTWTLSTYKQTVTGPTHWKPGTLIGHSDLVGVLLYSQWLRLCSSSFHWMTKKLFLIHSERKIFLKCSKGYDNLYSCQLSLSINTDQIHVQCAIDNSCWQCVLKNCSLSFTICE